MTTTTLTARYLTFADEARPSLNFFGRYSYSAVDGRTGMRKQTVLWFANPFPAGGANVTRATLRLWTRPLTGTGSHTLSVALAGKWANRFGSLTWQNKPAPTGPASSVTKTGALKAVSWDFDVAPQMQLVANGQAFAGLVVSTAVAEQVAIDYLSGKVPTLTVEWSQAPLAPGDLAPSAGRVVGEARPVLRWSFTDRAGDTTLRGLQVQTAATTGGFASPAWDSGVVDATAPELDLDKTSFPAPAAGVVVWWRVRHKDGAGLWSAWSTPTSFTFRPRPAVSLTSPPDTGLVSDPTPPVSWTATSQSRWQASIYVRTKGGPWQVHETSGVRIGQETTWQPSKTPPARLETAAQIKVWDSHDREGTPGVTPYVYDDQQFTFRASGTASPVMALVVTPSWPVMGASLSWSRAEQPDEWLVSRDGDQVLRVPGNTLLKAGSQVVYEATGLIAPHGVHTWTVAPIVNGKVSANAASVSLESRFPGSWLVDPDTGDRVCIIGDVDHGTDTPEDAASFTPLGAKHTIVITGSMRGREGKVDGLLAQLPHMPADQTVELWRKRLLRFKTDKGLVLRWVSERDDIPVLIDGVAVVPDNRTSYGGKGVWRVRFNWRQCAEYDFDGANL